MKQNEIADIIFKEVDVQAGKQRNFPTTLEELGLVFSEDRSTNCWIANYDEMNEKYNLKEALCWDDEWQEDRHEEMDGCDLIVIDGDINYEGDLDLGVLFKAALPGLTTFQNLSFTISDILVTGNVNVKGTLVLEDSGYYILGDVHATNVEVKGDGTSVLRQNLLVDEVLYHSPSEGYFFPWFTPKAMLYICKAMDENLFFFSIEPSNPDKAVVVINVFNMDGFNEGELMFAKKDLKDEYLLFNTNLRFPSDNPITDAEVRKERLIYAIKNDIPYLRSDSDLSLS